MLPCAHERTGKSGFGKSYKTSINNLAEPKMEDGGLAGVVASEKEIPFPGAYVLSGGYISHTSNPARWARQQEMKMMYIMALAGPSAHVRALYKTKSYIST